MKVSVEKPGSPSEILEHHGVKGQKWGVRQRSQAAGYKAAKTAAKGARASGASNRQSRKAGRQAFKSTAKETSRNLRTANKAARETPKPTGFGLSKSTRQFTGQHPTAKLRAQAIKTARKESYEREKTIRKTKDSVERARLQRDHLNHPGTPIAMRMTRGEKVVGTLLVAYIRKDMPLTTAYAVGSTTGRSLERRRIEKTQRKGGFR